MARRKTSLPVLTLLFLTAALGLAAPAHSQDKPRYGGELVFLVPSEPPSYDGHREGTFGIVHPLAPHYNTLLRIDPTDRTGTRAGPRPGRVVDDLARRADLHAQAAPGRAVPRRQPSDVARRQGQLRQDRLPAGRRDLAPQGEPTRRSRPSRRPIRYTVRFRLKWPEASFLVNLASPFNWIYKADILARTCAGTRRT